MHQGIRILPLTMQLEFRHPATYAGNHTVRSGEEFTLMGEFNSQPRYRQKVGLYLDILRGNKLAHGNVAFTLAHMIGIVPCLHPEKCIHFNTERFLDA